LVDGTEAGTAETGITAGETGKDETTI